MPIGTLTMPQHAPVFKLDQFLLWSIFLENAKMDMDLSYTNSPSQQNRTLHPLNIIRSTSQVCTLWRNVLLQSPSLWAQLIDIEALWWGNEYWRKEVLSRTGEALLSVKGCVRFYPSHDTWKAKGEYFLSILDEFWPRIRRLRIEVMEVGIRSTEISRKRWQVLHRPAPNLELFHIHFGLNSLSDIFIAEDYQIFSNDAPSLRHFIPTNLNFPLSALCFSRLQTLKLSPSFDVPQILQAFQTMESLRSLSVNLLLVPGQDSYLPFVTLPQLCSIHVSGSTDACMPLLDHITPAAGCRIYLETRGGETRTQANLETTHRVLTRYSKSYLKTNNAPSISINIHLSSFTFYTNSISSLNDSTSPDFKFKVDALPDELPFLLSALTDCNFKGAKTFYIDSHGLPASDTSFSKLFKSLVSVEELELTPDGMDFLLKSDTEFKIFPSLRTIKVAPFIAPTNIDMVLPFLHWRREMGTPIAIFDLELHPLAGFPINFSFLEEMAGMKVLWKAGQDSQSYTCGSGDPEVLNFKYDPLQLMYEIRKL